VPSAADQAADGGSVQIVRRAAVPAQERLSMGMLPGEFPKMAHRAFLLREVSESDDFLSVLSRHFLLGAQWCAPRLSSTRKTLRPPCFIKASKNSINRR